MSRSVSRRASVGGLGALALLTFAGKAHAVNCPTTGSTIYAAGGSSQETFVGTIAAQLANLSTPIWLVYNDTGSACVGYQDLVGTPQPTLTSGLYWDTTAKALTSCTITTPAPVTLAIMGNSPAQCPQTSGLADGYGEFLGPVQSIDFVVPVTQSATQQSLSTEAAYYIWGFGAVGPNTVAPWTVPANIYTRSASSFLTIFLSLETKLPVARIAQPYPPVGDAAAPAGPTQWKTTLLTESHLAALNGTAGQETGIGFVSSEIADAYRSQIRVLAYQHTGQTCGYWPDSTADAFDKINVRTGQYWLWSPVHFFAAVNAGSDATKVANVSDTPTKNLVGWFTGDVALPAGVDVFASSVAASTVPRCAMQAWRDGDLSDPYSYQPPASCSCKFDFATGNVQKAASCKTCATDNDCNSGQDASITYHCRNIGAPITPLGTDAGASGGGNVGYCEVN
jgi:hypothetical protein